MGSCTLMFAFQLKDGVRREDMTSVVPDLLSLVLNDVTVVYPTNGMKATDGLVVAVGNKGKSHATLRCYRNGLLTLDVAHECRAEDELQPMAQPYTLDYIRTLDRDVESRLGNLCDKSLSIYVPIRRTGRLPFNYAVLADERLMETDYTHLLYDFMSPFQRITILQSRQFGRVLTLDDDIMFGESDEVYVTTVLGLDRGNNFEDTTVLILGGGDGGILYTLTSLPRPPNEDVMKACRKYMRSVCGNVLDTYRSDTYQILVKDCLEVLKDSVDNGEKYDYVINDLTEFSVEKEKYGFSYDFKTNNVLMELSFQCLKDGGKYLARGNCLSAKPYIQKIEEEFQELGVTFRRFDKHVPSFRETYCFFEAEKPNTGIILKSC